ncbi:MAG: DUF4838 domain-containing protein, partial [Clostridia bacterium]|nr:DUF4838 domain-containing protein [Clostridia bacterium]
QISGAELPIVSDAEAPAEHEIVVGKTNRETEGQFDRTAVSEDGFMLDIADGRVYIVGGASLGTLYGAYTFLEEHLGCRFYTYDFERVPQNESIGLVACEDTQTPVIATRHSYWYDVNCNGTIRDKQKMNIDYYRRANGIHTIPSLAGTGDGLSSDPCLLADSVYETVLASVRSLLEARPDAQYISVSQSDGGICECTDCRASYEIHGESGHYLRFVNRIAEEIADEYPNVLVHTFAYGSTTTPPKDDTVAADNVLVQLCTTGSCHAHSLKDCPENRNFLKILDGWGKICKNLSIWDYQTNFSCFNSMQPYFSTYFENAKIFADNHAVYYFAQGDNFCSSGEFSGLKGYLVARLLWDPYMDRETYDTYMNEFLCDYYGPGWREIRAFIDQAEKDCTGHQTLLYTNAADPLPVDITYIDAIIDEMGLPEYTVDDLRNMMDIDWDAYYEASGYEELYPNRSLKMGYEAFENALALAENDEQRTHIERSTIQLDTQKVFFMDGSFQPKLYFLKQLFYRLVSVCIANGTLDDVESYTLIYQFDGWILDSLYRTSTREEIAEHNRALAKKMLDYGVYWMGEAADLRSIPYEEFNFEKGMPVECHRGSTGGHISWLPEHN